MSQHLRFRGALDLGDGQTKTVEVWVSGTTAVAFDGGTEAGVLRHVLRHVLLDWTPDRRIRFRGETDEGEATWEGVGRPVVAMRWSGVTIRWPGGDRWTAAEVEESQYGVRVTAPGQTARQLPGARTELVGPQRWVVDGDVRILAETPSGRGCGCGK